ncbi:MAG TPA: hypothetical protein VI233_14665 [Puia sp.]
MIKILYSLLILPAFGLSCLAQDEEYKEPGKGSQAYHEQRLRETTPPGNSQEYIRYYWAYIDLNKANEDLIIQRATDFYKGQL